MKKVALTFFKLIIFALYLAALVYLLFAAEGFGRTGGHVGLNLTPFAEIRRYLNNVSSIGLRVVVYNLFGNILLFIPMGYLLPSIFFNGEKRLINCLMLCVVFSAIVEVLQFLTASGSCDVDDVILNTFGGLLGYLFYAILRHDAKSSDDEETGE